MRTEYRLWHWPEGRARSEKQGLYPTAEAAMDAVSGAGRSDWHESAYAGWHLPLPDGDRTGRYQSYTVTAEQVPESPEDRIGLAMNLILDYGQTDGDHHKAWVIDQVARILTGPLYAQTIEFYCADGDGPDTYEWDEGVAP